MKTCYNRRVILTGVLVLHYYFFGLVSDSRKIPPYKLWRVVIITNVSCLLNSMDLEI